MRAVVTVAAVVVLVGGFIGVARATDASTFCNTCHEMKPYYDAWKQGSHGPKDAGAAKAECIDCHVAHGFVPRLAHKFVALNEVYQHFFGNTLFPLETPPTIPDPRCTRCHSTIETTQKNFSHELHASKAACQDCHPATGHAVTREALKQAAVLSQQVVVKRKPFDVAVVNGGKANVAGHVSVPCARCHDMLKTGCPACHKQPANHPAAAKGKGCTVCHKAGARFAFVHPAVKTGCAQCHKAPAGAKHPAVASGKDCPMCHRGTGSWKFTHPAGADCAACHKTTARHPAFAKGMSCSSCHKKPGVSWAWDHPGRSAACQNCHRAPANHYKSACASCHRRPGSSWAFSHPGTGGEHSYTSFACAKCHPSGPPRVYCTCHNGRPPTD